MERTVSRRFALTMGPLCKSKHHLRPASTRRLRSGERMTNRPPRVELRILVANPVQFDCQQRTPQTVLRRDLPSQLTNLAHELGLELGDRIIERKELPAPVT